MFRALAIALVFLAAAPTLGNAVELTGEVAVIESNDGSIVTLEHAEVREIAGQSFVGGKVLSTDAKAGAAKAVGSRIWIAGGSIARITEFDTKAQFTGQQTTGGAATGRQATTKPGTEIARIEDLGGTVMRENQQPDGPVVSVDLSDNQKLKDDDLKLLSSFPDLRELHLHGTTITDAGLKHLAGLTNLTYLGLIGAENITDEGLKELVGLQKLEELRIGNTGITDAGLKELAKLKNLKMVGLIGTPVTEEGLKEFSEALPDMHHNRGAEAMGGGGGGQRADPNFDVTIESPAYVDKHPSVLFDEAHQNFHTASGRYKVFADLMTNDGYQVTSNTEMLTPERLAGHNILIIANACALSAESPSAFTEAECDSVQNWVNDGGSLLLITDHEPFGSASEALAKRFGVWMSLQVANDPVHETGRGLEFSRADRQIGNHPIMTGRDDSERVNRVLTFTGQSLKGPVGSAALLKFADTAIHHWDDTTAAGRTQGLALNHGKGRVVVMGEAAQLSAQVFGEPPIPMGMNVPDCDNRKMALNVMHWLSGLLGDSSSTPKPNATDSAAPAATDSPSENSAPKTDGAGSEN